MENKSGNTNFKLGHLNARSLISDFSEFSQIVVNSLFDVITVSETWLSQNVTSDLVHIDGYRLFRKDRVSRGGGVAMYIKNEFSCNEFLTPVTDTIEDIEHMWVEFKLKSSNFLLGVVYRPPHTNINQFIDKMDNILSSIVPSFDTIVVTGDFNINLFNLHNPLEQCFSAYNFSQIIDEPTRVTSYSSTLIDPIFINTIDIVSNAGTLNADLVSDHRLVFCNIAINFRRHKQKMYTYRDFKSFNRQQFTNDLNNIPWQNIIYLDYIEEKIIFLQENVLALFDLHAPIRTARMNKPPAPWLTPVIKRLMKERDNAFTKYKQDSTPANWLNYKTLRNYTLMSIRREKVAYLKYLQGSDTGKLWKSLKCMNIQRSSKQTDLPVNISDPNIINNTFISVFDTSSANQDLINFYLHNKFNANLHFSFTLVDVQSIQEIIMNIKSNASGNDGITL